MRLPRFRAVVVSLPLVVALTATSLVACSSGARRPGAGGAGTHSIRSDLRVGEGIGAAVQLIGTAPHAVAAPDAARSVAAAEIDFTLALLKGVGRPDGVAVSPASLAIALAMLRNGAAGRTASEIGAALRSAGLSAERANAGWSALINAWASDPDLTLESANSVWTQSGFEPAAPFMAALSRWYATGVWQVDFARDLAAAGAAINAWAAQQTHGRIDRLFQDGQLDASTRLVLANAVYFKADWATPFDPNRTADASFSAPSGRVAASFMNTSDELPAAVTDTYSAVQLPYRGGRFAALALMPTSGSLAEFTASLSSSSLAGVVSALQRRQVDLAMPAFTMSSTLDLNTALARLGMPTAFSDRADFSGIAENLMVQQVVQRAYLRVDENGTEAAAVTGIAMRPTSVPAESLAITLDHPFLFLVRDTATGAILFAAQVVDPA